MKFKSILHVVWLACALLPQIEGKVVGNIKDDDGGTLTIVNIEDENKTQYYNQNYELGNYNYGYDVKPSGPVGQFHHENKSPREIVFGCYGYEGPDTKNHMTFYVSDAWGYRPVKFGEDLEIFYPADNPPGTGHMNGQMVKWQDLVFPEMCTNIGDRIASSSNLVTNQPIRPSFVTGLPSTAAPSQLAVVTGKASTVPQGSFDIIPVNVPSTIGPQPGRLSTVGTSTGGVTSSALVPQEPVSSNIVPGRTVSSPAGPFGGANSGSPSTSSPGIIFTTGPGSTRFSQPATPTTTSRFTSPAGVTSVGTTRGPAFSGGVVSTAPAFSGGVVSTGAPSSSSQPDEFESEVDSQSSNNGPLQPNRPVRPVSTSGPGVTSNVGTTRNSSPFVSNTQFSRLVTSPTQPAFGSSTGPSSSNGAGPSSGFSNVPQSSRFPTTRTPTTQNLSLRPTTTVSPALTSGSAGQAGNGPTDSALSNGFGSSSGPSSGRTTVAAGTTGFGTGVPSSGRPTSPGAVTGFGAGGQSSGRPTASAPTAGFGSSGPSSGRTTLPTGTNGFGSSGTSNGRTTLPTGSNGFGSSGPSNGRTTVPTGTTGFGSNGLSSSRATVPPAPKQPSYGQPDEDYENISSNDVSPPALGHSSSSRGPSRGSTTTGSGRIPTNSLSTGAPTGLPTGSSSFTPQPSFPSGPSSTRGNSQPSTNYGSTNPFSPTATTASLPVSTGSRPSSGFSGNFNNPSTLQPSSSNQQTVPGAPTSSSFSGTPSSFGPSGAPGSPTTFGPTGTSRSPTSFPSAGTSTPNRFSSSSGQTQPPTGFAPQSTGAPSSFPSSGPSSGPSSFNTPSRSPSSTNFPTPTASQFTSRPSTSSLPVRNTSSPSDSNFCSTQCGSCPSQNPPPSPPTNSQPPSDEDFLRIPGALMSQVPVIFYPDCGANAYIRPAIVPFCPSSQTQCSNGNQPTLSMRFPETSSFLVTPGGPIARNAFVADQAAAGSVRVARKVRRGPRQQRLAKP